MSALDLIGGFTACFLPAGSSSSSGASALSICGSWEPSFRSGLGHHLVEDSMSEGEALLLGFLGS
jgi:hypothetical protein